MKAIGIGLLVTLTALLPGCESRPAAQSPKAVSNATAPADSVMLAAAMASARLFTASLGEARQAVLRQATLPPDTSAPLIPKPVELLTQPAQSPDRPENRRYVGTLGGQPVVLELVVWPSTQNAGGTYYFGWGGQVRQVSAQVTNPDQPLFLVESTIPYTPEADDEKDAAQVTGTWQATQRLGPTLTGIWTDKKTRRTARFELHENYDGTVRYEEIRSYIEAKDSCRVAGQLQGHWYYLRRDATWYNLHLVGPDTLRPAWRRLQCPVPQTRKQQLAALLTRTNCSGDAYGITRSKLVNYNGDGLFCWTDVTSITTAENMPGERVEEHTYDLATGQEYRVADWLRPDKLREIGQLATAYYAVQAHDGAASETALHWKEKLPTFLLSSDGVAFRASGDETSGEFFITFHPPITIPYAAVAPYVRPGTPLARLVAARARPGK
jgi:hypothetical protein